MFNIYNLLAAASIGYLFHIDPENIKKAIDSFTGVPMRMEFREFNGMKIISDVYNANPASMGAAVSELARIRKRRSIAVLGDMLELGRFSEEAHRQLGKRISELPIDFLMVLGEKGALVVESAVHHGFPAGRVRRVKDHSEAGQKPEVIKAGSYAYGPAQRAHVGSCASAEPCLLFISFEVPVDAVPVD